MLNKSLRPALSTLATAIVFLATWQAVVVIRHIHPIVLPPPTQVCQVLWAERQTLTKAFLCSATASLAGLFASVVIGFVAAILFSQSKFLRQSMVPYVMFLQTVPIVAIAPLLVIWSGPYWHTVVLVTVIVSLFPIISNTTAGLISVDKNLRELFRLAGANRWQTLLKLNIPAAVSHLVLGARISAGLSVIGAIIGEFFVGTNTKWQGLGTLITSWKNVARTDAVIAATFTSTLLGLLVLGLVNLIAATLLRKWTRDVGFESGE